MNNLKQSMCDGCNAFWLGKFWGYRFCNQCQSALDRHDCHAGEEDGCACQELVGNYADDFRVKEIDIV